MVTIRIICSEVGIGSLTQIIICYYRWIYFDTFIKGF